jgi:TrkA domain protein
MTDPRAPRPAHLPGVGTRIDLRDEHGRPVAVVARDDGGCDLYVGAPDRRPVELDPSATRALAALLSGNLTVPPELIERLDDVVGGLTLDWLELPAGSPLADRSIAQSRVRQRTGTSIVAVLRGAQAIVSPEPDERLRVGDQLVVIGREVDVERFRLELGSPAGGGGHGP